MQYILRRGQEAWRGVKGMARGYHGVVLRQIQRVFSRGTVAGMSEEHLLERFVARKDDAAFEAAGEAARPDGLGRLPPDPG